MGGVGGGTPPRPPHPPPTPASGCELSWVPHTCKLKGPDLAPTAGSIL